MPRARLCTVGAAAVAASLVAGCGASPDSSAWPRVAGTTQLVSMETGSEVDTAYNPTRYRTLVIASRDDSSATLKRRSILFAQSRGWRLTRAGVANGYVELVSSDGSLRAVVDPRPRSLVYDRVNAAVKKARSAGEAVIEVELSKR